MDRVSFGRVVERRWFRPL